MKITTNKINTFFFIVATFLVLNSCTKSDDTEIENRPAISYSTPNVFTVNKAIIALSLTNTGGKAASYAVSPTLPAGLSIDPSTGVISGIPTTVTATATYTVTATNSGGSSTFGIVITVNDVVPTTNLKIEDSNTFTYITLSATDFAYWNNPSNTFDNASATEKVKAICKKEIYSALKDDFDFIIFDMNNIDLPAGMPYGIYNPVKNDVQGIGKPLYDHTADYGSAGKLQGIYFLYKNNIDLGPVIHEFAHRWANSAVPQNYSGHWDDVKGILTGVSNNMADIELYLAGAIPASEITDPASLAIYNDSRYVNKVRIPSSATSQKIFRSLVIVLTPQALTSTEITSFKTKIGHITTQEKVDPIYQNMKAKSRGHFVLNIGGLDASKK